MSKNISIIRCKFKGVDKDHGFRVGNIYDLLIWKDLKGKVFIQDTEANGHKREYFYLGEFLQNWDYLEVIRKGVEEL